VVVAVVVFAKSVESETHRRVREAEGSFASALRLRAGIAGGAVRAAAAAAWVVAAVACAPRDRAVDYLCRANQDAWGVGAASLARFCLILSSVHGHLGARPVARKNMWPR
jgi:hypothetical protein